jgi:hypothetical protein
MRTFLTVLASLVLGLTLAPSGAQAAGLQGTPKVVADCQHLSRTPHRVVAACADLNSYAKVTHWSTWSARRATGEGTWVVNTCKPDCASGTFKRYSATFGLYRARRNADGATVFTKLGVTYVKGGEQHNVMLPLPTAPLS